MTSRRTALLAVSLIATAVAAEGCTATPATAARSVAPSTAATTPTPAATGDLGVLAAAARRTQNTTVTYTTTSDLTGTAAQTGTGRNDPAKQLTATETDVTASSGPALHIEAVLSRTDLYLKMNRWGTTGLDPDTWVHLDATKISPAALAAFGLGIPTDPTNTRAFVSSIGDIKHADNGVYTGTADATKIAIPNTSTIALRQAHQRVAAIPCEATIDDHGYLARMKIHIPALNISIVDTTTTTTFTNFGQPVTIDIPAPAHTQEAPTALYKQLTD